MDNLEVADRFFAAIERCDIATIRDIYAPDAVIWHNFDGLGLPRGSATGQSVEENVMLLGSLPQMIADARYTCWYQENTESGFVRQHILSGKNPDGTEVALPVCVICSVVNGRITKLYEYLDVGHLPQAVTERLAEAADVRLPKEIAVKVAETVSVTFVESDGRRKTIDVEVGRTLMEGAKNSMIDGIVAECGGQRTCGSCHCYIGDDFSARIPPPTDAEREILEFAIDVRPQSRLSCQIRVERYLDGLVVCLPASQL